MSFAEGAVVGAIVFVAALLQVTLFASLDIAGGVADVLLLVLLSIALLRGAVVGAVAGFFGGLLVDVLTLDTLGVSALLYALAGYWAGRYGETTGRDRAHAPFLSVAVVTVLYQVGLLVVHFVLGESAPGGAVMRGLIPAVALNLILTAPVYAVVRRLLRPTNRDELTTEVQLLG